MGLPACVMSLNSLTLQTLELILLGLLYSCWVLGDTAVLMIASDNELRQLNPYKPQAEGTEGVLSDILENKTRMVSVDIIHTAEYSIAFWTDYHMKAIIRYNIVNAGPKKSSHIRNDEPKKRVKRQQQGYAVVSCLHLPLRLLHAVLEF